MLVTTGRKRNKVSCAGKTAIRNRGRGGCADLDVRRRTVICRQTEAKYSKPTSLQALIRDYLLHYQLPHDDELMWFRNQSSLEDAVRFASEAQDCSGHRYFHQRRIKSSAIAEATKLLLESHDDIQGCSSFHELWNLVSVLLTPVRGIGELYTYDTSLRIGAYLRLKPEKVYLHAGTRIGARKIGLLPRQNARKQWLEASELPARLRDLSSADVENLLCIYKDRLPSMKAHT